MTSPEGHQLEAIAHMIRAGTTEIQLALQEIEYLMSEEPPAVHLRTIACRNVADLSTRQLQVLSLIAEAKSNSAIAQRLYLTEKTVEAHVSGIFSILELSPAKDYHRRVLAVLAYLGSRHANRERPERVDKQASTRQRAAATARQDAAADNGGSPG